MIVMQSKTLSNDLSAIAFWVSAAFLFGSASSAAEDYELQATVQTPDIVFESDRSGSQQLYTMKLSTKKSKRISFGKGSYATPVWSPRGDTIAFTKLSGGEFYIGVMLIDGEVGPGRRNCLRSCLRSS